jgi:hypothetical protein
MAKRPQLPPPPTTSAIQPAAPPAINVYQARRARGFFTNLIALLLQPGLFFRTFPSNTQWVIVALLILLVTGIQAVRQPGANDAGTDVFIPPVVEAPIDNGGSVIGGGGAFSVVPPPGFAADGGSGVPGGDAGSSAAVRDTTTTAILAAGTFVIAWLIQAVVLLLVPLLRGRPGNTGRNLQIAVWASVPLGLMILFRLIYFESGGAPESPGLSALIEGWTDFAALSPFVQQIVYRVLSSLTLFWLWNIVLFYLGARFALNGRVWAAFLVTLMWLILAITIPVVTGNVTVPTAQASDDAPVILDPLMQMIPEGDFNLTPDVSGSEALQFEVLPETAPESTPESTADQPE